VADVFRDYSVSLDECAAILRRASLPGARAVRRIPRGEVNCLFDVELVDGRRVVLKVQVRGPRPEALHREREACSLLAKAGIRGPSVIDTNTSRDLIPSNYSLLSYVPGLDGDAALKEFSSAEQAEVFRWLGRTLGRIHAIDVAGEPTVCALPAGRPAAEWAAMQSRRFEAAHMRHKQHGYLPGRILDDARAFWAERRSLLGRGRRLCLLHGDYQVWNVKLAPPAREIAGVLDLDQVDVGEPEFDFAALECGLLSTRADLREAFRAGYSEIGAGDEVSEARAQAYTLLRHLELMLAYQGPVRYPDGAVSDAGAIARLISPGGPEG